MTQDVLLRAGDTALVRTTALTAIVVAVSGVQAGTSVATVQPLLPISGLVDDFDAASVETGRWEVVRFNAQGPGSFTPYVQQALGLLVVSPGDSQMASGVRTRQCYDLTEDAIAVQCVSLRGDGSVSYLAFRGDDGTGYAASLWGGVGYLWLRVTRIGATTLPEAQYTGIELHVSSVVGLSATSTATYWLRWRHASGTLFCDVAPATADNPPTAGQWVTKWSGSPAIAVGCVTVELLASAEFASNVGYFDALNTTATVVNPAQAQDVRIVAGSSTAATTPRFTPAGLPVVVGRQATVSVGTPTVGQLTAVTVAPMGQQAVAGLSPVLGADAAALPVGLAPLAAVAMIDFMPKPLGRQAVTALGVPVVTAPDRLVAVSGRAASPALGVPIVRRFEREGTARRLLLTLASGAD